MDIPGIPLILSQLLPTRLSITVSNYCPGNVPETSPRLPSGGSGYSALMWVARAAVTPRTKVN